MLCALSLAAPSWYFWPLLVVVGPHHHLPSLVFSLQPGIRLTCISFLWPVAPSGLSLGLTYPCTWNHSTSWTVASLKLQTCDKLPLLYLHLETCNGILAILLQRAVMWAQTLVHIPLLVNCFLAK